VRQVTRSGAVAKQTKNVAERTIRPYGRRAAGDSVRRSAGGATSGVGRPSKVGPFSERVGRSSRRPELTDARVLRRIRRMGILAQERAL